MSNKKSKKRKSLPVPVAFGSSLSTFVTLEIEGYNRSRLLKELDSEGIRLTKVRVLSPKSTQIRISYKDSEKTFAICRRLCYTYRVTGKDGALAFIIGNLRRAGLIAGILIAVAITAIASLFVHEVKIVGASELVGRLQLLDYLRDNGVSAGTPLGGVNRKAVEKLVRDYDGVADCSVAIEGCTLTVTLIERDQSTPAVTARSSITSSFDAVVTRVICSSGTAKVKTGSVVKRGDMLIEGKAYDQNGEELSTVPAVGTVYGRVTSAYSATVTTSRVSFKRTGKSKTATSFRIFGLNLGGIAPPYAYYESESSYSRLFGIKTEQITYYETAKEEEELAVESIVEEYENKVISEFIARYSGQPEKKTAVVPLGKNAYKITVYLQTERIIS